jgi:hypothetical protein
LTAAGAVLADWTFAAVNDECAAAHRQYTEALNRHYAKFFTQNPELASSHPQLAKDLACALPEGFESLAAQIPKNKLHRHHLSGKSSQIVALGLLGGVATADPSLGWVAELLSPFPPFGDALNVQFEREVPAAVLNEQPRTTDVDFFVETDDVVLCAEAKFAEDGLGRCSCPRADQAVGNCAERILERPRYWQAAKELLQLPERTPGSACPISVGYQAVRNVAAAVALAELGGREAVFGLFYDARNPYFRATGEWPGWPEVLRASLEDAEAAGLVRFRCCSWQTLVAEAPLPDSVRIWAQERHGL